MSRPTPVARDQLRTTAATCLSLVPANRPCAAALGSRRSPIAGLAPRRAEPRSRLRAQSGRALGSRDLDRTARDPRPRRSERRHMLLATYGDLCCAPNYVALGPEWASFCWASDWSARHDSGRSEALEEYEQRVGCSVAIGLGVRRSRAVERVSLEFRVGADEFVGGVSVSRRGFDRDPGLDQASRICCARSQPATAWPSTHAVSQREPRVIAT